MLISDWSSDVCSSDLDPRDVVSAVERLVSERAQRAQLRMTIELPESLPRLNADERKLKQVLLNLMSNAIKFTPEGGRVALTARRAGDGSFVFEVSDTVIGLATEDIPRAFQPFRQVARPPPPHFQ